MIALLILVVLCILLSTATACSPQPELCFDHFSHDRKEVEVVFDWGEYTDAHPASMSPYLFPINSNGFTRHEFTNNTGGVILLPSGRYTALAFNSDREEMRVVNDGSPETFALTLRDAFETQGLTSKGRHICHAPDSLWIGRIDDVDITGGRLIVPMTEAVCRCRVEVRYLHNRHLIRSVSATLSGLHRSICPAGTTDADDEAMLSFDLTPANDVGLSADIFTFGHCGFTRSRSGELRKHEIGFYVTLGNGTVRYHAEDVTEQIHSQPADACHIIIDTLDVPLQSGAGMDFSVDDGRIINIDVTPNKPNQSN